MRERLEAAMARLGLRLERHAGEGEELAALVAGLQWPKGQVTGVEGSYQLQQALLGAGLHLVKSRPMMTTPEYALAMELTRDRS